MWVKLLQAWGDSYPGETLKVGYHTMIDLIEKGIAVQCDPPEGATRFPEREQAIKPPHEKR